MLSPSPPYPYVKRVHGRTYRIKKMSDHRQSRAAQHGSERRNRSVEITKTKMGEYAVSGHGCRRYNCLAAMPCPELMFSMARTRWTWAVGPGPVRRCHSPFAMEARTSIQCSTAPVAYVWRLLTRARESICVFGSPSSPSFRRKWHLKNDYRRRTKRFGCIIFARCERRKKRRTLWQQTGITVERVERSIYIYLREIFVSGQSTPESSSFCRKILFKSLIGELTAGFSFRLFFFKKNIFIVRFFRINRSSNCNNVDAVYLLQGLVQGFDVFFLFMVACCSGFNGRASCFFLFISHSERYFH